MNKIELLAPAGNLEKLKFAYLYGADACYIGGRDFSLRANAKNFSIEEINEACSYAHNLGKRVYVTVNIVFHNEDINGIIDYLKELAKAKVDAIIVSDPLVIDVVKENNIDFRYNKLKTENENATQTINELQAKLVEVDNLQKQLESLQNENVKIKLDSALDRALVEAKVQDVDYLKYKIKEKNFR